MEEVVNLPFPLNMLLAKVQSGIPDDSQPHRCSSYEKIKEFWLELMKFSDNKLSFL